MARITIAACATVSLAATLYVGRHSAAALAVVLIAGWVVAPFLVLLWAPRRPALLFSVACAIVYLIRALAAPDSSRASVFVGVPAASWVVIAAMLLVARPTSRE